MRKLLLITLIFSIFGCKKESPTCGMVVAKPTPYIFPDSVWYSVAVQTDDELIWFHVDSLYYTEISEGMYICK